MSHDSPAGVQTRRSAGHLEIGDTIHITRGALAGVVGVISSFTSSYQCVLKVEGLADGILIVMAQDAVARLLDEDWHAAE
jgi:hypothetical protein